MQNPVQFAHHFVACNGVKARVHYSLDNRVDGRDCVTIYHKDYTNALAQVFAGSPDYVNNTDTMTDYFEKGRATLFADSPLYAAARATANAVNARRAARYAAKVAART